MWTARFERLLIRFAAAIRARRRCSALEASRTIACVEERLQNNFLLPNIGERMSPTAADHDSLQIRSQGVARHSCGAH